MVTDHSKANAKLAAIAQSEGVALPAARHLRTKS
jgi:hypothetical protein